MKNRRLSTIAFASGAAVILSLSSPADASVRFLPSHVEGAPAHALPISAAQESNAVMLGILEQVLKERHGVGAFTGEESDAPPPADAFSEIERIARRGIETSEPREGDADPSATEVREDLFASETGEGTSPAPGSHRSEAARLSELLASEQGLRALAMMSADQIEAMTFLALALEDPSHANGALSRARSPGLPELPALGASSRPDLDDLGEAMTSMLLDGWNVRMDAFGRTIMFQEATSGSDITIDEGMVIGALGEIVDIRKFGDRVIVNFESGDTLSGDAASPLGAAGIPPLPPAARPDAAADEIILSRPVSQAIVSSRGSFSGRDTSMEQSPLDAMISASGAVTVIMVHRPDEDSTRPMPRSPLQKQD